MDNLCYPMMYQGKIKGRKDKDKRNSFDKYYQKLIFFKRSSNIDVNAVANERMGLLHLP